MLFTVRVYQSFFSALMPSACKFYPSCSHYAAEAITVHGARRGSWLALRRILRCHPFSPGGVDLVPDPADFARCDEPARADAPTLPHQASAGFSRTGFSLSILGLRTRRKIQTRQAKACPTEVRS